MSKKITNSWNNLKKELLKDPETYKEYKQLEPEYRIVSEITKIRIKQCLTQKNWRIR
jgi:hypothetical protein